MVRLLVVTAVVVASFLLVNRLYRAQHSLSPSGPQPGQTGSEAAHQGGPLEIYQSRQQLQQHLNQSVKSTQQQVEALEQSLNNP